MINRRVFNQFLSAFVGSSFFSTCAKSEESNQVFSTPILITTWNNKNANDIALNHLQSHPNELITAIEKGINYVEADPSDTSVGFGGFPDRDGNVTLDACIMDNKGNAGSVTYLKGIKYPVSVARKVMEETPHVILSGDGAQQFAVNSGFKIEDLNTDKSKAALKEWLKKSEYHPKINIERHDTIGMIGMSTDGKLSGACSTSGLAFKMAGRVGDSPIIGAGLFVDNEVGSAVATGLGELVLKTCSTFLVVEFMRSGLSAQKACESAIQRIIQKTDTADAQVGLIALDKKGKYGAYSIHKGFNYVVSTPNGSDLKEALSYYD